MSDPHVTDCRGRAARDWLRGLVRRLTWRREIARMESKLKIQAWRMADIENDRRAYFECYTNNLQHCAELERENRELKEKLSAQKKYVRAANRGAERNSIVSQMLAARLAKQNQQPPNLQECELCHNEYSLLDVEMTDSGQILCKKCRAAATPNVKSSHSRD